MDEIFIFFTRFVFICYSMILCLLVIPVLNVDVDFHLGLVKLITPSHQSAVFKH